jgi:hypothetical protein
MTCNACGHERSSFARAKLLGKYDVEYFRCAHCGLIQTEQPYWLDEAYASAVTEQDLGSVNRAVTGARFAQALILSSFDCNAKFIDYGGGYGIFVRLMRDAGFDFYRSDAYCENLFAKGFDAEPEGKNQYELLTAYEVFEHLVDPMEEIGKMLTYSRNLLFTTLLVPPNVPKPGEWWYYAVEHGQHITLYTREALSAIAHKFNLHLRTNGVDLHLLSEKRVSQTVFKVLQRRKVSAFAQALYKRRKQHVSLLTADVNRITGWHPDAK